MNAKEIVRAAVKDIREKTSALEVKLAGYRGAIDDGEITSQITALRELIFLLDESFQHHLGAVEILRKAEVAKLPRPKLLSSSK